MPNVVLYRRPTLIHTSRAVIFALTQTLTLTLTRLPWHRCTGKVGQTLPLGLLPQATAAQTSARLFSATRGEPGRIGLGLWSSVCTRTTGMLRSSSEAIPIECTARVRLTFDDFGGGADWTWTGCTSLATDVTARTGKTFIAFKKVRTTTTNTSALRLL